MSSGNLEDELKNLSDCSVTCFLNRATHLWTKDINIMTDKSAATNQSATTFNLDVVANNNLVGWGSIYGGGGGGVIRFPVLYKEGGWIL